jgi:hypothetical protein
MHAAGLAREFWSLAVKHIVWCRNRLWHRSLSGPNGSGLSPFQALFNRPPVVSNARVWGCDAYRLDHYRVPGSFEPKGKKSIFVGLSPNRKGWVLFDPKTRKMRTTFHCAFDESLNDRRCGLRDFVLRPRKAGPGGTRDEERIALLEGELYDPEGNFKDDMIDDASNGFRVRPKTVGQQRQLSQQPPVGSVITTGPAQRSLPGIDSSCERNVDEEEAYDKDLESSRDGDVPEELVVGGPGIGGSPSGDGNLPRPPPIPQR